MMGIEFEINVACKKMTVSSPSHDKSEQIAIKWFGSAAIGLPLKSVVNEIAKYAHDLRQYGTPAQRKRKLKITATWAAKLKAHLAQVDPTTRRLLFAGDAIATHTEGTRTSLQAGGPALNADALSKLIDFEALLTEMAAKASNLVAQVQSQSAGAPELPDAVYWGVECLASFWRKYRDEAPTSGQNTDSFGNFAEEVLCAEPVNASTSNVQTALRYYFSKSEKDQPKNFTSGESAPH